MRSFGPVATKIGERLDVPATVVRVHVPKEAQTLLHRPFELAHLEGRPLAEAGVRFIYQLAGAAERSPTARYRPSGKGR